MAKFSLILLFVPFFIFEGIFCKIPTYIEPLICKAADAEYQKCVLESFEKSRPYLIKGIPELSLPPLDPFELPLMTINRNFSNTVQINATIKNIHIEGAKNVIIQSLKANPIKHYGEIRLNVPWMFLEMEYEIFGQILTLPLQGKGFFRGNFTNIQFYVKGSLETYKKGKNDAEYFRVKKIDSKTQIENGSVKLLAKNPQLQFGADLISNFFNENPRRFLDAVNPIFIDTANELYRVFANQILGTVKASEWLPK